MYKSTLLVHCTLVAMSSRSKKEMSPSEKEQMLADMVVNAVTNFSYLGLTVDDIGIPPMTADKKSCSGHSWKNFCMICRFNYCWICGGPIPNPYRGELITCWKGVCGRSHADGTTPSVEHHSRVSKLVKAMIGGVANASGVTKRNSIVLDSDDDVPVGGGGGWAGDRRIQARPVPRIQLATAPPARKTRRVDPAPPVAIAPQAVVPQINIAVAPLAQVRVEGVPRTEVNRVADGVLGNARFEVNVTIVLEQMMGQV